MTFLKERISRYIDFSIFSLRAILRGGVAYYAWVGFLVVLISIGLYGYYQQYLYGHIVSNMNDSIPWGFFIGTYAFLVGVAAAAVALAVPGYVYHWEPIREVVILGEIIAISALVMSILFVMADLGHPERFMHLIPFLGRPNLPLSMIAMNVMILNGYLILNILIVTYFLYCSFTKHHYNKVFFMTLMLTSIPAAICIHATTAFIFAVLPARPFWHSAILVPRFISTALCAGPAIMILAFKILRKVAHIDIKDKALFKIAEIAVFVLFVNILLFLAEVITEFRGATVHTVHIKYYFGDIAGHMKLRFWALSGAACNVAAFFLLLVPKTRNHHLSLSIGCVLIIVGVFIEKGMGLVLPGLMPGTLGEWFDYHPSIIELLIGIGIIGTGTLVFTVFCKVAIPLAFRGTHGNATDEVVPNRDQSIPVTEATCS